MQIELIYTVLLQISGHVIEHAASDALSAVILVVYEERNFRAVAFSFQDLFRLIEHPVHVR